MALLRARPRPNTRGSEPPPSQSSITGPTADHSPSEPERKSLRVAYVTFLGGRGGVGQPQSSTSSKQTISGMCLHQANPAQANLRHLIENRAIYKRAYL